MTTPRGISPEDELDALYRIFAVLLLCHGSALGVAASKYYLDEGSTLGTIATWLTVGIFYIGLSITAYSLWRCFSSLPKLRCLAPSGFILQSIQKAAAVSLIVTYLSLGAMLVTPVVAAVPPKFLVNLAMTITALTFSLTYLYSSRAGDVGADDAVL